MRSLKVYLIGAVLAHFAVVLVHGGSHFALGIIPPALDSVFIVVVIIAGPPVTLLFLRINRFAATAALIALMLAGFAYGLKRSLSRGGPGSRHPGRIGPVDLRLRVHRRRHRTS